MRREAKQRAMRDERRDRVLLPVARTEEGAMKRVGFASAWDSMTRGNVAIDPDGNVYRICRNRLEVMSGGLLPWCAAELKAVDVRGRWQVVETVE